MTITQTIFETYVPAFRDCDSDIFNLVEPFFHQSVDDLTHMTGLTDDGSTELLQAAAYRAAYLAIPQLDLALTANGFAVVSNQNLTPASRQRTESLREQMRRAWSDAFDLWISNNLTDYAPKSLLYTATLCRTYGMGADIYFDEYQAKESEIAVAEEKLKIIISPEQHDYTLQNLSESALADFISMCRHFIIAFIRKDEYGTRLTAHSLKDTLLHSEDDIYAEYKNSSTYQADVFTPYENKQEDPTYFFG